MFDSGATGRFLTGAALILVSTHIKIKTEGSQIVARRERLESSGATLYGGVYEPSSGKSCGH